MNVLFELAWHFLLVSLMAFGGASATLPEMHRFLVSDHHWLTDTDFNALFAISQASPGPNVLFVALFGWRAAGFPGAFVSLLAMIGPSSLLAMAVERYTSQRQDAKWLVVIRRGLAPMTIGLLMATGTVLAQGAKLELLAYALTAVTVVLGMTTKMNPLWLIALGALCGLIGLV